MRLPETLLIALTCAAIGAPIALAKGPNKKKAVSAEEIGLRKAPLTTIAPAPPKTKVKGDRPGVNKKYNKSYDDAPPMVPHVMQDYLPIGLRNQCLACHTNPPKKYRTATQVPDSHYVNRDGKPVNTEGPKSVRKIYLGFYNCTMCHAPQKNAKPLVDNALRAR